MIDCDVHNTWSSVAELRPYLAPAFRDWFDRGEVPGARPSFPAAHRPWLHPEDFKRFDAMPENGGNAGSDYELMCTQLLDRYELDYAVLTGDEPIEVSTLANPYVLIFGLKLEHICPSLCNPLVSELLGQST